MNELIPRVLSMDEFAHLEPNPELWTDKKSATPGYICHDYLSRYQREFGHWRNDSIRLLEIGLNKGASIKLWLQYFPNATVYGIDINDFKNEVGIEDHSLPRFTFVKGDAGDVNFWNTFNDVHAAPFDVIIDDGCHFSGPIQIAFNHLWRRVSPGGYYIIEDLSEVRNPNSHTEGFPTQVEIVQKLIEPVILGHGDIEEIMVSRDLCMIRKTGREE